MAGPYTSDPINTPATWHINTCRGKRTRDLAKARATWQMHARPGKCTRDPANAHATRQMHAPPGKRTRGLANTHHATWQRTADPRCRGEACLAQRLQPYFTFFIHARIGPETVWSGVSIENTSDMWLSPFS